MNVIDTHMHINDECSTKHFRDRKIDEYLDYVEKDEIKFFIPSINPKTIFFTCDMDCSNNCTELDNKKEKVCPVECKKRDRHRVKVVDGLNGSLIAYCTKCNKIIYEGIDPFREYNIRLIELCKIIGNSIPNLVLSLSNSTINNEVIYYEKNFNDLFLGYKLHQTTNMRSINDIKIIESNRPLLIHCDSHEYDSIDNAVNFAKRYDGNVILAHSYLLHNIEIIENVNNIYFDVCPTDNFKINKNLIKHNQNFDIYDNIYEAAINYLDEDKILFGTDWPYGNISENLEEIKTAKIDEKVKKKIMSLNAEKAYKL